MSTPLVTAAQLRRLQKDVGALLLGPSAKGRRPRDLSAYREDPLGFVLDVLGADPWSRQLDVVAAVRQHRQVAVKACHSSGKDHIAARLALWWVYGVGGRVICSAPTQHQLRDILFDGELKRALSRSSTPLFGSLFAQELWLEGEDYAGIQGLVSSKEARLTGRHAPRTMILVTEANGVEDHAYEDLISNAVGENDVIVALGNPLATSQGWYRRAFRSNSGWHQVTISADDVFDAGINVPNGKAVPGMITPAFVEHLRREYGERSPIFQAKVNAEFPAEGLERCITTRADLERAAKRYGERQLLGAPWSLACDVGRDGDPSAICWHQGYVFHGVETCQTPTGPDAVAAIQRKSAELTSDPFGLGRWPVNSLTVDAIGVGASVSDVLTERGIVFTEFKGNEKSDDENCLNKRAQAYVIVSRLLAKNQIALPPDPELWEELLATTWFVNERGRIQIVDKNEIKHALGRSPNKADALSMAAFELENGASVGGSSINF